MEYETEIDPGTFRKIQEGHNIYQQIFLRDLAYYFGNKALADFLKTDADSLKKIYSLRTCLWHRRELIKKKDCEGIVQVSIGNSDFDPDEFITYEQKAGSIEEYSLYRRLYDEHYGCLLDLYKPWENEDEFCIIKPPEDIPELLRVCNYDDQGNQCGPFINRVLNEDLKVLLVRTRTTARLLEYYYIQDNNMICVTVPSEENAADYSAAETYATSRNLTLINRTKDFVLREDAFLEALTAQYEMGKDNCKW